MSREFDSNEEYEAWVLERGRQEDEDRYWAEYEFHQQQQRDMEAAMWQEYENYYRWMAPLFWYQAGFYENEPSERAKK